MKVRLKAIGYTILVLTFLVAFVYLTARYPTAFYGTVTVACAIGFIYGIYGLIYSRLKHKETQDAPQ